MMNKDIVSAVEREAEILYGFERIMDRLAGLGHSRVDEICSAYNHAAKGMRGEGKRILVTAARAAARALCGR